jgi:hypothetical protein
VISGFRRDVDEICTLLGCYAASSGNPLPTLRDSVSVQFQGSRTLQEDLTFEDGNNTLSRNVGKRLPLDTPQYPRIAQILCWYFVNWFSRRICKLAQVTQLGCLCDVTILIYRDYQMNRNTKLVQKFNIITIASLSRIEFLSSFLCGLLFVASLWLTAGLLEGTQGHFEIYSVLAYEYTAAKFVCMYYRSKCNSNLHSCRSRWPRGLRHGSAAVRLLRSWVGIPPGA